MTVTLGKRQRPEPFQDVEEYPAVFVYELDPAAGVYAPTGVHRDRLKVTVPFDIDIDLTEIERL